MYTCIYFGSLFVYPQSLGAPIYVCMYVCMYVCKQVSVVCMHSLMVCCVHSPEQTTNFTCMFMCPHVCMYVCLYVCKYVLCVCMQLRGLSRALTATNHQITCMFMCPHVCMYVYIYIHNIHKHTSTNVHINSQAHTCTCTHT